MGCITKPRCKMRRALDIVDVDRRAHLICITAGSGRLLRLTDGEPRVEK
jgi:hypothetical protein